MLRISHKPKIVWNWKVATHSKSHISCKQPYGNCFYGQLVNLYQLFMV